MEGLGKERVLGATQESWSLAFDPDCARCLGLLANLLGAWCKL